MPPEPLILAFDTSAAHCAVALLSGAKTLASRIDDMARGQAEHLMPMLAEVLVAAGYGFHDLSAIGVGVGPGNFTGIRISVAAARGLALGLQIPAIGISGFEAMSLGVARPVHAVINAPRDMVYVQRMGQPVAAPRHIPAQELAAINDPIISLSDVQPSDFIINIARLAARPNDRRRARPAPLYIRAPDAAPSRLRPAALLP